MSNVLERFIWPLVKVSEQAAIASAKYRGQGNNHAADQAAVTSMRASLAELPINGRVVIGEGERDEAPMLFIGEELGAGGIEVDIAVDPLEGTSLCAEFKPGAMSVIAISPRGGLLQAPDVYMEKMAVGPGLPSGIIDLNDTLENNIRRIASAKKLDLHKLTACILDRPRHAELIKALRRLEVGVKLIQDGDIAACIHTALPDSGIDLYLGSGGAPEGVLAATALKVLGGQLVGRLLFRDAEEKDRAYKLGITDLDRQYSHHDLATGDTLFVATGVTTGDLLPGVLDTSSGRSKVTTLVIASNPARTIKIENEVH